MADEQKLSEEQRELVAVGASVGAGCHPCVSYHVKAGAKAGLSGDRLLAAVTSAERVAAEAAERMAAHARSQLGAEATAPVVRSPLDEALASFGAALGANDLANIERHMLAAAQLGASRTQLQAAIEMAQKVQENATRIHVREAEKLLEGSTLAAGVAAEEGECGDSCPCHTDDNAASVGATAAIGSAGEASSCGEESASGQASNHTAGVAGHMAKLVASAGAGDAAGLFAGMADCRAMFEGACAQLAAAQGNTEASAATLTTAGSTKED
jgi:AhpD family alkylhydroperoxidase